MANQVVELTLYYTEGCHLCDLAEEQLLPFVESGEVSVIKTDIADNPEWVEAYGERIPVLKTQFSKEDLGWPFSTMDVANWLDRIC